MNRVIMRLDSVVLCLFYCHEDNNGVRVIDINVLVHCHLNISNFANSILNIWICASSEEGICYSGKPSQILAGLFSYNELQSDMCTLPDLCKSQ